MSSMRHVSPHITSCETLRMINDLCQSDSDKDQNIRDLCVLGIIVGKIVSLEVSKKRLMELVDERKEVPNRIEVSIMRCSSEYKHNWKNRDEIKSVWGIK